MTVLFTRHKLTDEQAAALPSGETVDCSDLAGRNLSSLKEAGEVLREILERVGEGELVISLYGVVPVPLRAVLVDPALGGVIPTGQLVKVFEAFNIQRSVEGGKPTFTFNGWLLTGEHFLTRGKTW